MTSILISILALGFIITIHELGHFLFAKLFKVGVVEFSLGMGPTLCSFVKGETRYSLRLLPFGGSCMMVGEECDESEQEGDRKLQSFVNGVTEEKTKEIEEEYILIDGRTYAKSSQFVFKPAWQRFLIIVAGPVFNFVLAFLLSIFITAQLGYDKPYISSVEQGMPADESGLEDGDIIRYISIDGSKSKVTVARDISVFLLMHQDEINELKPIKLGYTDVSDGSKKEAVITPEFDDELQRGLMGIKFNIAYVPIDGITELIRYSAYNVEYCIKATIKSLQMLVSGDVGKDDVMGPVRMVATMDENVDQAMDYGLMVSLLTLFDMMILISGSLGAMNLLPIPALDGGRLLFIIIEMIRGKAVPRELENKVHMIGMTLLLIFMVLVFFNDIFYLILDIWR
ncbi:MAG: site-2 protease family protein [Eubacteriales bacterium]|nr:site-2 protease family protein [Eubacteriales bacterium]